MKGAGKLAVDMMGGMDKALPKHLQKYYINYGPAVYNMLRKWYGSGAYGNSAAIGPNARLEQEVPEFATPLNEEGCISITRKEFLGNIGGQAAFTMQAALTINPGVGEAFPWLSEVAKNYCMYKFESLMYVFKSTSGALSTTQGLGTIVGACNYNVYESAPTSTQQMLNEVFADSKVPSEDCIFPIECEPSQTTNGGLLFVRGGTAASGDQRMYDLGNFYLATEGQAGTVTGLGQLWVTYTVKLYKPQLITSGISTGDITLLSNTAYTNAAPLGSGTETVSRNDIGISHTGTVITFPAFAQGTYLLHAYWVGTATAVTNPTWTASSGITVSGPLNAPQDTVATSTNVSNVLRLTIIPNATAQTLTLSAATLPSSGSSFTLQLLGGL